MFLLQDIDSNDEIVVTRNSSRRAKSAVQSLTYGSISSASTTVIFQPLELLKTRIQLQHDKSRDNSRILGRAAKSAFTIANENGFAYLWRGTGASLLRSVPGVGLYYATLNVFQTNLSSQEDRPDNSAQAFYFGLTARSMVSFVLLPITVIKVRYESGQYKYQDLFSAVGKAYTSNGWVGITPTILRDSLFSGIYYMCYTELKSLDDQPVARHLNTTNFLHGIISGFIASVLTNPLDVLKTKIQVNSTSESMIDSASKLLKEKNGYMRLFDGLAPRSLRRTLIAASTWTFYEFMMRISSL